MSCIAEFFGVHRTRHLPSSPEDFPLETAYDLRRAYTEYVKYNDERLIFSLSLNDLSELGREIALSNVSAQQPPLASFNEDDFLDEFFAAPDTTLESALQTTASEDRYWRRLKERIDAFLGTLAGQAAETEACNEIADALFATMHYDVQVPIPEDLYERIIVLELTWRAEAEAHMRIANPYLFQTEAPMAIAILAEVGKSHPEPRLLQVPFSHSFEEFGMFMCHQSGIEGAKDTDVWSNENPNSDDVHDWDHFRPLTEKRYLKWKQHVLRGRCEGKPEEPLRLFHETQIRAMRRTQGPLLRGDVWDMDIPDSVREEVDRQIDEAIEAVRVDRENGGDGVVPLPKFDGPDVITQMPQRRRHRE